MPPRRSLQELEDLAAKQGYPSYKDMLHELYVVQGKGLHEIAAMCHVFYRRTRKHLLRFGIPIRARGGPNNVKVVLTDVLVQEIIRDGVPAVAERLGVTDGVLRLRLAQYVNSKK